MQCAGAVPRQAQLFVPVLADLCLRHACSISALRACRGMVLSDWGMAPRKPMEVMVMVEALAELVSTLHSRGRVHRDLKPDNVLYLMHSAVWRLLDMGIAATAGAIRHAALVSIVPAMSITCAGQALELHICHLHAR